MKKTVRKYLIGTLGLLAALALTIPVVAQNFTSVAVSDGSLSAPSMTFLNDTDTGFYRTSSGTVGIVSNGTSVGTIGSTGLNAPQVRTSIVSAAAGPTALSAADCGRTIVATATSGTTEWTLPAATNSGCRFTFVSTSANSEILLGMQTGDNIQLKATGDAGASIVTAAGTGAKNTAATNVLGDHITIVANGVTTWIMVGQSGIWAGR